MILMAEKLGCTAEIVTIVSMLSIPNVFHRPGDNAEGADRAREKFMVPESDHLTLLHVYQQWKANGFRPDWCRDHFVHLKALKKVREIRSQMLDIMKSQKIPNVSCGAYLSAVDACLNLHVCHCTVFAQEPRGTPYESPFAHRTFTMLGLAF